MGLLCQQFPLVSQHIDKNLRFCPFCPNDIRRDAFFLLECECYATQRKELFSTMNEKTEGNNIRLKSKKERFIKLLSNIHIIPLTGHYLVNKGFHTKRVSYI